MRKTSESISEAESTGLVKMGLEERELSKIIPKTLAQSTE